MHKLLLAIAAISLLSACVEDPASTTGQNATVSEPADLNNPDSEMQNTSPDDVQSFYFSYDDSSSTAARDLATFSVQNGNKPDISLGRPYEFLNAEQFSHFNSQQSGPFEISMGAYKSQPQELSFPTTGDSSEQQLLALGVNISGPTLNKSQRDNAVITLLVDVSGSMASKYAQETRSDITSLLDVTKHGLSQLPDTLKTGDIVNLVTFSTDAQVVLENWQYGQPGFVEAISQLQLEGSTNLDSGIQLAYQTANSYYDPEKSNRVIILTDAYANTGQIDATVISQYTVISGKEGIYFAGVGIGDTFNDAFLNELTEQGKGVYSAMITPQDAERIFTTGFTRFIDSAVSDVKFKLEHPISLQHSVSAAEEISEDPKKIQSIDFAYNTEQFFFELFSPLEDFSDEYEITLEIQYKDDSNQPQTTRITYSISDLLEQGETQIKSAAAVSTFAFLISEKIQCDDVLSSGLYQQTLDDLLFTDYQEYIRSFCRL